MASKRARTSSPSPTSPLPSPPPSPPSKAQRTLPSSLSAESISEQRELLCTLPPTCNPPHNRPTSLTGTRALEAHYATYHAHVCEEQGCGCVFPDARLLELHQTECHDPLAAVRKDRGEKIFACHVPTCPRCFLTPKARRLHLISAHGYPKEYYFAVTNKGVGGLLKRWGEGVSLVRGTWKPRAARDGADAESEIDADKEGEGDGSDKENEIEPQDHRLAVEMDTEAAAAGPNTPSPGPGKPPALTPPMSPDPARPVTGPHSKGKLRAAPVPSDAVDALASSLDALALVPSTIRFGRGARRGAMRGHTHGQPHWQQGHAHVHEQVVGDGHERGRGRGRGLGRGRAVRVADADIDVQGRVLGDGVLKRRRGRERGRGRTM
ncbi:hypothetical protein CERSUDRAFT_113037 [Gelatoporia subvermispora B]|uniref:C2H2-type domain-containing protein n=1 Tax=Ceriporiopsis subvermispora (strain B) TaxID=914234 RepID=M2R4D6_CERS8|nr:hypothetical protein CERSUDRAFT_113037 [Gelatoporia subvermispora B]